jgi:5-methylthioadenosine/S-adenosylhomocysteine deaminase
MDIAIHNSWILTLKNEKLGIIKNGSVGIEGKDIVYVGSSEGFNHKSADIVIDGSNHLIMPGLVNCHIHTSMQLLRGGAQDLPEIEWMNKGIGPLAKHVKGDDIILGSKLGVLEAIKTGTTTFSEYTRNVENLVKEVYLPFNTRVVATETINEVSQSNRASMKPTDLYEFDTSKGEQALRRNENLFKIFQDDDLVTCLYGPQALDMVSLQTLKRIKELAIEQNSRIHMHVAQGQRERLQIEGRFGKGESTVKILSKENFLENFLIGVHCHDTDDSERKLMVDKGSKMIGCPSSITMIDGIIPPIYSFSKLGGNVGIGTDQAPGPGNHNLFREMRTISMLTKSMVRDPTVFPAWEMLRLATIEGAKVLGLESEIGTVEVGKKADLITINLLDSLLTPVISHPFHNFIPNIVYSATGKEIDNVIINGKLILSDGLFTEIDEESIIKKANLRAKEIYQNAAEDWKKAGSKMVQDVTDGFL